VAVFVAAYLVMTARDLRFLPLGRAGGALVGAFLLVAVQVMTPEEAWAAIEPNTLVLLLGMMVIAAALDIAGFFNRAAVMLLARARTPVALLHLTAWGAGILSAFLVNDTVCLLLTPLLVTAVRRAGLPMIPYLFALCMGANIGSVATLSGNPQNMLIGALSGDHYRSFLLHLAPVAIGGLTILSGILHASFARELRAAGPIQQGTELPAVQRGLLRRGLIILGLVVAGFFGGARLSLSALGGACAVLVLGGVDARKVFRRVDWLLLLFFASLFVLVEGVVRAGAAEWLYGLFQPLLGEGARRQAAVFTGLAVLGSNLVSNVPFILVARPWIGALDDPVLQWRVLAMATTFAGNLTLLGSVANLIVIDLAGEDVRIGFWRYLRVGLPVTVATTAWGLLVLLLL
jgi:Na+/H+ antiporter NhaD/arsenite permease-like protein